MQVQEAKNFPQQMQLNVWFGEQWPVMHDQLLLRQRSRGTLLVGHDGEQQRAKSAGLVLIDGELGLRVRWVDGSVSALLATEIEHLVAEEPKLPECSAFEGSGTRCSSCRVRKAMHA